jgi:hypothetical protein
LTFTGVCLLSLGAAYFTVALYHSVEVTGFWRDLLYYLTLQPLPRWARGLLFGTVGAGALGAGIWRLSDVVVIPLSRRTDSTEELVLGYRQADESPTIAVLSGGPGILRLADLARRSRRLTCVTPVQDPVEYYYRAASLFHFENVLYVAPMPAPMRVFVTLDNGNRFNIKEKPAFANRLASHYVTDVQLEYSSQNGSEEPAVFRQAIQAFAEANLIILGPGGLFESIIPNLLVPEIRQAIQQSKARTVYICNLMTEPGLTTGFSVADHIRQIERYGGFSPDYVLVNAQRIDPEVRRLYEAAHQSPVYLSPEEYEETIVSATDRLTARDVVVEGSVVVEVDVASSVVQLSTSLDNPGESRAVQVLRHDPEKLTAAILEILRRS